MKNQRNIQVRGSNTWSNHGLERLGDLRSLSTISLIQIWISCVHFDLNLKPLQRLITKKSADLQNSLLVNFINEK